MVVPQLMQFKATLLRAYLPDIVKPCKLRRGKNKRVTIKKTNYGIFNKVIEQNLNGTPLRRQQFQF